MKSHSRSLSILICLFLISFKVVASSVFIEAAIERAEMYKSFQLGTAAVEIGLQSGSSDDKQDACSLFLMSHVTASVSSIDIAVQDQTAKSASHGAAYDILFTQNIPDSAFKPPKYIL
ncbi:hypothetical protein FD967_04400 [Polynucleobacter sp. JS-Mosq-20-D10]|uniref:hypothetical protein n=1 Tax=Polynucleobacter sp. JS-Mosq-20-D10 TaxID=2576922 RepID=UPI001BFE35FE|nr:hypothetical protein [Polynucleobacter sp. JS-Mosq-20-D10]QWE01279.1 hypothetical protein FD967_04400 [Polynucleobacter sp. JS-Mosq-20-D10]